MIERVRAWLADHVSFYTTHDKRTWFGIGAVHGPRNQLADVAIAIGTRAVALHGKLDAGR